MTTELPISNADTSPPPNVTVFPKGDGKVIDPPPPPPQTRAQMLPTSLHHLNPIIRDDLIRCGSNADGGYIVPRSTVVEADALLSFGLGFNWSFEEHVAKLNPNLIMHVYDNSVTDGRYLEHILSAWNNFRRSQGSLSEIRAMVEHYESYRDFFQGNFVHFQERVFDRLGGVNDVSVDKIIARLDDRQQILLKMDIDGGEYRVIDDLLVHQDRIRAMVIEFHATEYLREMFLGKVDHICQQYEIVHIHGNNYVGAAPDGLPDVLEITFLHRSLCGSTARRNRLPITGLDFPNNPGKADHELVFVDVLQVTPQLQ
jgi:hypothetical protein